MSAPDPSGGGPPHHDNLHAEAVPSRHPSVSTNAEEVTGQTTSPMASQARVRFSTEITPVSPRNSTSAYHTRRGPLEVDVEASRLHVDDRRHSRSPRSPTSPRNTAFSLRNSLFRKNVEEVQEQPAHSRVETASVKAVKDEDANVTIVPVSAPQINPYARKEGLPFSSLPNYKVYLKRKRGTWNPLMLYKQYWGMAKRRIYRINEIHPSKDGRHIVLDASRTKALTDERTGKHFVENWIRSTRYTIYSFLPQQLFAQFSKLANFYFLCISILQLIPKLSTTGNYTTIIPLLFFVSISMGKEGYDDYRRHRLDKEENRREATVLDHQSNLSPSGALKWTKVKWRHLKVGDVIKLKRDEAVPADIVLLNTKSEGDIAYIETMALDGETNLKSKQTIKTVAQACNNPEGLVACRAEFVVEDPNPNLYAFEGRVTVDGITAPLTNNEIIYRGSVLRNTPEAVAMVVYTGEECKIRMNANKHPRTKAPHLQFVLNRIVMIVVCFVISLAIFNTIAYQIWRVRVEKKMFYLQSAQVPFEQIMFSFVIMFSTMIPLSLYVSMEIIKLAQMFMMSDVDMYDEKTNTPFEARTSTINEELGQVTHIFSDKTGTLTDNEMKFRKLSIAGTVWLHDVDLDEEKRPIFKRKRRAKGKRPAMRMSFASDRRKSTNSIGSLSQELEAVDQEVILPGESRWRSTARPERTQPERSTRELLDYLLQHPDSAFAQRAKLMLLSMALCHTCLPETKRDGSIDFQAASPDELALVRAAQEMGYLLFSREHGTVTLTLSAPTNASIMPVSEVYEILDVVEFSSNRKRMSVVVRFPDGRICVICKGADSVVMRRLKLSAVATQKATEVELRAERRKSIEAHMALARRSTQVERKRSLKKQSGSRHSLSRRSTEIDDWLTSREHDVALQEEGSSVFYPADIRQSLAFSDPRSSMAYEEDVMEDIPVADDPALIEQCLQHINDFATEGLRTLLYAYKFLDDEEYANWKKIYADATTSLVDREDKVEKAGEVIEHDFDLAGATAIEDKLQKGVPETMDKLRRANIRIWMLTGDKRETAINIGHSCRLIKDYSTVIVLDREIGNVQQIIENGILKLQNAEVAHSVIVIDGHTLAMIDKSDVLEAMFFDLAVLADSVICCRAQPSQKARIVRGIRKRVSSSITLAIGDGANDIAMIQEAHVGIGITGKEGLQAARTSDYSIAQFRFLNKLLLVHGRWNYIRTCKYILGTLWKEFVFFLTQAIFQRWNGYTGTSLYEPWSLATFNTLFTSLPVLVMGIFEKDLAASTLLAVPELYKKGQKDGAFNIWIYLGWMALGATESMILFYCMFTLFASVMATRDNSLFAMGDLDFVAVVIIISMKMQLIEMHNKSIIAAISAFLSIGAVFLWNIILAGLYPTKTPVYQVHGSWFTGFGRNPTWWFTVGIIVLCVLVLEISVISLRKRFFPSDADVFQELERDPAVKARFEEAAAPDMQNSWSKDHRVIVKPDGTMEMQDLSSSRGRKDRSVWRGWPW